MVSLLGQMILPGNRDVRNKNDLENGNVIGSIDTSLNSTSLEVLDNNGVQTNNNSSTESHPINTVQYNVHSDYIDIESQNRTNELYNIQQKACRNKATEIQKRNTNKHLPPKTKVVKKPPPQRHGFIGSEYGSILRKMYSLFSSPAPTTSHTPGASQDMHSRLELYANR